MAPSAKRRVREWSSAGSCRWGSVMRSCTMATSSSFRSFKSAASVSPAATLCLGFLIRVGGWDERSRAGLVGWLGGVLGVGGLG